MISRTKEAHRRSLEAHTKRVGDKPMSREEIALVISRTKEAHRRRLSERDKELAILGEDVAILEERVERLREDMDEMKKSELATNVCAMLELWQALKLKEFGVNAKGLGKARFFLHLIEDVWEDAVLFSEHFTEEIRCKIRLLVNVIRNDMEIITRLLYRRNKILLFISDMLEEESTECSRNITIKLSRATLEFVSEIPSLVRVYRDLLPVFAV
jgi:hypothetical protein